MVSSLSPTYISRGWPLLAFIILFVNVWLSQPFVGIKLTKVISNVHEMTEDKFSSIKYTKWSKKRTTMGYTEDW